MGFSKNSLLHISASEAHMRLSQPTNVVLLLRRGPGPSWVCLKLYGSVRVLIFVQERFHNLSEVILRVCLLKLGILKQARAREEEATGESIGEASWSLRKCYRKEISLGGGALANGKSEKRGSWKQVQWFSLGLAIAAHCSPRCKPCGVLQSLRDVCLWEKKRKKGKVRGCWDLHFEGFKGWMFKGGLKGGSQ